MVAPLCYNFAHLHVEGLSFFVLKGKASNRPILRYSINVSHPCIVVFFINNIWPEFANYSIRARLRFINFTGLDGLNEAFFSIY